MTPFEFPFVLQNPLLPKQRKIPEIRPPQSKSQRDVRSPNSHLPLLQAAVFRHLQSRAAVCHLPRPSVEFHPHFWLLVAGYLLSLPRVADFHQPSLCRLMLEPRLKRSSFARVADFDFILRLPLVTASRMLRRGAASAAPAAR